MKFLFVDNITELVPGKKTVGTYRVTDDAGFFTISRTGDTVLANCILGEALGQLCSWNVMKSSNFELRLIGGITKQVEVLGYAKPGDLILLENTIRELDLDSNVVHYDSLASVNGKPIIKVTNSLGPLLPLGTFSDPEVLKDTFIKLTESSDQNSDHKNTGSTFTVSEPNPHFTFDEVLSWDKGKQMVASKTVAKNAPFFADHFPRKPVLPLSLLSESNSYLALQFVEELVSNEAEKTVKGVCVRRIKMSDFVEPGSTIVSTVELAKRNGSQVFVNYKSEVNGKKVCGAQIEFNVSAN